MSLQKVRIIGGKWRSRKLNIPDVDELRPSPDRVRETLFNWLAPYIHGMHCLDLFAGTGVLGFEALSRGAASVLFTDTSSLVIAHLLAAKQEFNAEQATVLRLTIPQIIPIKTPPFDLVFIDPPFHRGLVAESCQWLHNHHYLADHAYIYLEAEKSLQTIAVPESWQLLHHKTAGQVGYHLYRNQ